MLIIAVVIIFFGYFVVDNLLFNGIKPQLINVNNFQANYFSKKNIQNKTTVILIGVGQWGDYWGQKFASKNMVGLSIPYTGKIGLPKLPEEIELSYFKNVIDWLQQQPQVNPNKIVVMGASRNAELSLILASIFPNSISGVIAYAPSSVSWSNTVLPYNSDTIKASWTYNGNDIPYIPMSKLAADDSETIDMLAYWQKGLGKSNAVKKATIKVENIKGSILLFSGMNDKVWPSSTMADMIEKRLKHKDFDYTFENIKYQNAGHLISTNPDSKTGIRTGNIHINGINYKYDFGGNDEGDFKAKQDANIKVFDFLNKL
ncbi:palmitoyl-CoA hydrolase [Tenacibaculum sp. M341]|nr:palmitoyl-CoA hydrolase [Tenacibaculum sp. M341]